MRHDWVLTCDFSDIYRAESWNGNTGACNRFAYRFSDIRLAHRSGGVWRPLRSRSLYEDTGYRVVQTSRVPSTFLATSR